MNISDFHRVARMIEQLQPNLGSYANIEKTIDQYQPNLGSYANIEKMIDQYQPNLDGALADIEKMIDQYQPNLDGALADIANIEKMIDQYQPNLGSYADIEKMIDQYQPNLGGALADIANIREMQPNLGGALADISNEALDELIAAPAEHNADIESPVLEADSTDAIAPPSSSTDLQDVPEGLLEVVTAELLVRLGTWCDLYGVLVDIEGLEAARLEVARQIDECLRRLARSVDFDGVCWGCDEATLIPYGVACEECAVIVAQMMLEALFLAEGLS